MTNILKELKTPQELLNYLNQYNFSYGYIGKNNRRYYSGDDPYYGRDFDLEYRLQTPEELLNTGVGICWDYAELERAWFEQHNYEFKMFLMVVIPGNKPIHNNLIAHTFIAYKEGEKWCWFEYAFENQRGIHEFDNIADLLSFVKEKQLSFSEIAELTDDINDIKIWEHKFRSKNAKDIINSFKAKI